MDKISSILPSNSRLTTVDMKNSGVQRSGMPSFGREVAVTGTEQRRMAQEAASQAQGLHKEQMDIRAKDPRAEIVTKMANNFFMSQAKNYGAEPEKVDLNLDESNDMSIEEAPNARANSSAKLSAKINSDTNTSATESDDDSAAIGQNLNVQA